MFQIKHHVASHMVGRATLGGLYVTIRPSINDQARRSSSSRVWTNVPCLTWRCWSFWPVWQDFVPVWFTWEASKHALLTAPSPISTIWRYFDLWYELGALITCFEPDDSMPEFGTKFKRSPTCSKTVSIVSELFTTKLDPTRSACSTRASSKTANWVTSAAQAGSPDRTPNPDIWSSLSPAVSISSNISSKLYLPQWMLTKPKLPSFEAHQTSFTYNIRLLYESPNT